MNATPTLEMLDPATLSVDINVRKDAALTAGFVASIAEHGVMEPVIAHRRDDGSVHVLMGQRRTRAAVEAGRPLIPVMIIDSPAEADRIVTQVVENIQRTELTEADEAEACHQLSLIGVSASAIAKKTGRTRTTVESALKAKSTDTGSAGWARGTRSPRPWFWPSWTLMRTRRLSLSQSSRMSRRCSPTSPSSCGTAATARPHSQR